MLGWKRGNATSNSRILILCLSRITTGPRILWTWTKNRWSRRDATAILTAVGTTPTATGWCACCFSMMRMREIQPVPCKRVSTYILGFWYACCFIKIHISSLKKLISPTEELFNWQFVLYICIRLYKPWHGKGEAAAQQMFCKPQPTVTTPYFHHYISQWNS